MNPLIQIAMGTVPAFLLLLIATLITRKKLIRRIVSMALLAGVSAISVVLWTAQNQTAVSEEKKSSVSSLDLVYCLLSQNETEEAKELLDNVCTHSLYVPEYALCQARILALQGNYRGAKLLYEKAIGSEAGDASAETELQLVSAALGDGTVDPALAGRVEGYGADIPGFEQLVADINDARTKLPAELALVVSQKADTSSRHLKTAAEAIGKAEALYTSYLEGQTPAPEELSELLSVFKSLENKEPALFYVPPVRLARLKAQIIAGDFKEIGCSVDNNADYNELLIVTELYVNGYITDKSLPKDFGTENISQYETVIRQLETVYREQISGESAPVRRSCRKYLDELSYRVQSPAMAKIQDMLSDFAADPTVGDSTKIYLQLSRVEQLRGNDVSAGDYLTGAMNSVGNCTDANFTEPMYRIINVIDDKSNTEELKNIAQYVDDVISHSTTLELTANLKSPAVSDEAPEPDSASESVSYNTYFSDYVSQKRASVTITGLDTEKFPQISMEIAVDSDIAYSADQLRSKLHLTDCGAEINGFTVTDASYDKTNIMLVCDTSGSMEGNAIRNLRDAVSLFVNNKSEKENVGIITFNSDVSQTLGFSSTSEELNAVISSISAYGGTNMYDAVIRAISEFPATAEKNTLNIIILLSDGHDNSPRSTSDINAYICQPCIDSSITLYSIGLGSNVDSDYLDSFTAGTGGSYLYVSDSATLSTFYDYLHNLAANRYKVDFAAYDTLTRSRTVHVDITDDALAYDEKTYSINGGTDDEKKDFIIGNKILHGLDSRRLDQSTRNQIIHLVTTGMEESDTVSVRMKGNLSYTIPCKYESAESYSLTIPGGMAVGIYDMIVTVNGEIAYFDDELTLGADDTETVFGPYVFTSGIKETKENTIVLSGGVSLNGWLYFKGSVTLTGDTEKDASILFSDTSGCYVRYNSTSATGLAKFLAENNKTVSVGTLGTFTLYNDKYHTVSSDDYQVDTVTIPAVAFTGVLELSTPGFSLYPDRIVFDMNAFSTKFPFQDKILKQTHITDAFSFTIESKATVTALNVGIFIQYDQNTDSKSYQTINLGSMPMYFNPAEFKLTIDTIKSDYSILFKTRLAFIKADGIGLSLKWSKSLVPSEIRLYCDVDLNTNISGVPVTFSDFELALSDIDTTQSALNWTLEGKTKISVAKVSKVFPALNAYIGDVAVCSFRDTTLKFSLGKKYISLGTDFYMFDKVHMGKLEIECGKLSYTNLLLDMESESVSGLRVKVTMGVMWDSDNCDIDLTGAIELALTDRVIGITVEGVCNIEVKWWIFSKEADISGSGMIGMYIDHSGDLIFTVRARSNASGKNKGINISWSKTHGKSNTTKF